MLLAGRSTLLDQRGAAELLPACAERGVSVIAGGVLNSGILAAPRPGARFDYAPAPPELIDRARRIETICDRHGVPLPAAALQFPLGHPAVAAVLVGARSAAEIRDDARLFGLPIPAALWDELRDAGGLLSGAAAAGVQVTQANGGF